MMLASIAHRPVARTLLRRCIALVPCLGLVLMICSSAVAEELEMINRPANLSGLTGLLFTTGPFTVSPGRFEIGAAAFTEKSTAPDYSVTELPSVTLTAGLTETTELALKSSYLRRTSETTRDRSMGDTQLSWKWNFLPQSESSSLPALALIVTGIAPTSDRDKNFGGVVHWGAKTGLTAGKELIWGDHVIGLYADAQVAVQDLSDERIRDRYGVMNAGLIFPISKNRNLQMLLEYSLLSGIDKISGQGGDYSGITYGLRLVNERFNLSFGAQFLRKQVQNFDDSSRVIGMMSMKF